jgi:hypothetical protein
MNQKNWNPVGNPRIGEVVPTPSKQGSEQTEELGKFETLARKLMKVPKDEFDEKRREKG